MSKQLAKYDIPNEATMAETKAAAGAGGRWSLKPRAEPYTVRLCPALQGRKATLGYKAAFVKIDEKTMFGVNKDPKTRTYLDDLLAIYEKSDDPAEKARADYGSRDSWVFKKKFMALALDRDNEASGIQPLSFGSKLWEHFERLMSDKMVKKFGNPFDPVNGRDLIITVDDQYNYSVVPDDQRRPLLADPEEMDAVISAQPDLLAEMQRDVYTYEALKKRFAEAMGYEDESEDPVAQARDAVPTERQLRSSRWGNSVQDNIRKPEAIDVEVEGEEPLV